MDLRRFGDSGVFWRGLKGFGGYLTVMGGYRMLLVNIEQF